MEKDLLASDVLVVDDDPAILESVCEAVAAFGCRARRASDGRQAQGLLRAREPLLLITDYWMPQLDGLALIGWCRQEGLRMPAILMSADLQATVVMSSVRGPQSFLPKPFNLNALHGAMLEACEGAAGGA